MLNDKIKKYLDNLDKETIPLQSFHGEYKIAEEIKNIIKKEGESYKTPFGCRESLRKLAA